jgi:hypothetical protein
VHLGQAWIIEFSYRNIREYFYTKIRFSAPGSAPSWYIVSITQAAAHARMHAAAAATATAWIPIHACRFMHDGSSRVHTAAVAAVAACMHAGSYMPVHACRFIHASCCWCVRAHGVRTVKKCRVNLGSKSSGWPNIPVLTAWLIEYFNVKRAVRTRLHSEY